MNTTDILIAARKKIERPENWCKRHNALNLESQSVPVSSPSACKFCLEGALMSVSEWGWPTVCGFLRTAARLRSRPLSAWNDDNKRTHPEVLAAFDAAIELSKAATK